MFIESIYLIPIVTVVYVVWFFYPSFTGKREAKILPNEYAWFILSFVCIPISGLGLYIAILFLGQWYSNPMALDIGFVLFICTPWVVISGAVTVYGIRALWRLRNVQHAVEERKERGEPVSWVK